MNDLFMIPFKIMNNCYQCIIFNFLRYPYRFYDYFLLVSFIVRVKSFISLSFFLRYVLYGAKLLNTLMVLLLHLFKKTI
jgi:hypothetical protein